MQTTYMTHSNRSYAFIAQSDLLSCDSLDEAMKIVNIFKRRTVPESNTEWRAMAVTDLKVDVEVARLTRFVVGAWLPGT